METDLKFFVVDIFTQEEQYNVNPEFPTKPLAVYSVAADNRLEAEKNAREDFIQNTELDDLDEVKAYACHFTDVQVNLKSAGIIFSRTFDVYAWS
jgi:hypothetical protein